MVAEHLGELRRTGEWRPIGTVMADVSDVDEAIRYFCGVYSREGAAWHRYVGFERAMTIDEIHAAMRTAMPTLTRARLRKVLHTASRRRKLRRVRRGLYVQEPYYYKRWEEMRDAEEDPEAARWEERWERHRFVCAVVLLSHYLLPNLAAYRKAKTLGIADRTYYVYLSSAIEELQPFLLGRRMQRATRVHS